MAQTAVDHGQDDRRILTEATVKAWELSLLLVRLFRSLAAICASDETVMRQWMAHENRALQGIPSEQIRRVDGLVAVVDYLDAQRAVV